MPVYQLSEELSFPDPVLAEDDGLLAVGGDLRPQRLILAYQNGIFPWYSEGRPILWWCPRPRLLLLPEELHIGRTLRKTMRKAPYRITLDTAFGQVVEACAKTPRPDQGGTWITEDMKAAYVELHRLGVAHSVEAWDGDRLVGGLYGLALGTAFFGESMFARADDASKIAFATLVQQLRAWSFRLIDCQVVTDHLVRFGAREFALHDFLGRLDQATDERHRPGPWRFDANVLGPPTGWPTG
ncbi:MAG: leucyl/phenylalanyl-tRNA--protein transferase [Myxococcota bacterium]